jgi:hypothetical protein
MWTVDGSSVVAQGRGVGTVRESGQATLLYRSLHRGWGRVLKGEIRSINVPVELCLKMTSWEKVISFRLRSLA